MHLQSGSLRFLSSKKILRSKANDIAQLRKGSAPVTLDIKTLTPSAGADSAPSRDTRVEMIKYDPNFDNRVANHLTSWFY